MHYTSTIRLFYSCKDCQLKDIPLEVEARGGESVTEWMTTTSYKLKADHSRRSPKCYAERLTEVRIPITGTTKIGGAVVN